MEFNNSQKAFAEAKDLIPGGVDSPVRAFSAVGGEPLFIEKGVNQFLFDIDGNRYLDYVQSWGPLILGHADEMTLKAVCHTAKNGLSFGAPTTLESELAKEIKKIYSFLDKIRFVSSGTEAVMSAIRLARGFTGKNDIVKFKGCYHGHSDSLLVEAGSGMVTFGSPSSPGVPADFAKHTLLAEYNNLDSVKKCFEGNHDIACIILEPIAGNMGLIPAEEEFLKGLGKLCEENGALLIFDEVMSGFRASIKGAMAYTSVQPDIVTFGKVIGGGMPVGAFAARSPIMNKLSPEGPIYQAGTLSGNPVAMAAGLATVMQIKEEGFYEKLEEKAKKLTEGFKEAAEENGVPLQVDYRGSMFGFFFSKNPVKNFADACACDTESFGKFHQEMIKEGVYLACSAYETGFICSKMTDADIDHTIEAAKKAFSRIK